MDATPKIVMIATYNTRHFTFTAHGRTRLDCANLIYDAWQVWCKRTGADPDFIGTIENLVEHLSVMEITLGQVLVGQCLLYTRGDPVPQQCPYCASWVDQLSMQGLCPSCEGEGIVRCKFCTDYFDPEVDVVEKNFCPTCENHFVRDE